MTNGSASGLQEYNVNLTRLVQPFDRLHDRHTKILWVLQEPVDDDKNVQGVRNEQIDLYNDAAIEVSINHDKLIETLNLNMFVAGIIIFLSRTLVEWMVSCKGNDLRKC